MFNHPALVIHCDWSIQPAKRWQAVARLTNEGYQIAPPVLVPANPRQLLDQPDPFLLGLDVPLGLPLSYAREIEVDRFTDFLDWLSRPPWSTFFEPAVKPGDITLRRPFYPARPGGTRQQHLLDGLGVTTIDDLRRQCEKKTVNRRAAAPLFWTLGAQQVGKAALSAWREILLPTQTRRHFDVALWPFEGTLEELLAHHHGVIAEAYPAEFLTHLGAPGDRWSKRRSADRQRYGEFLLRWADDHRVVIPAELEELIRRGFGPHAAGEDPFDAVVGVMGMVNIVLGPHSAREPAAERVRRIEGWILGQPPPESPG